MTIATLVSTLISLQLTPLPSAPIQSIPMTDVKGVKQSIPAPAVATTLLFVAVDCPIANRMAPEISRIVRDFRSKGVTFMFIYVDPSQSANSIRKHLKDFNLNSPAILDSQHRVVKAMGATVTPQAVVLGPDGTMKYRGRINDLFQEHGKSQIAPKTNDLRNALRQILDGKRVEVPQTPAIGCSIPPLN
jgi:AhpC/TSA family